MYRRIVHEPEDWSNMRRYVDVLIEEEDFKLNPKDMAHLVAWHRIERVYIPNKLMFKFFNENLYDGMRGAISVGGVMCKASFHPVGNNDTLAFIEEGEKIISKWKK